MGRWGGHSMQKAKNVVRVRNKSVSYSGHRQTFNVLEEKVLC